MNIVIPEPVQFNPLKHHLLYIRCFIADSVSGAIPEQQFLKLLKHTGTSVMDVYTGRLSVLEIADETTQYLKSGNILTHDKFIQWSGPDGSEYRLITLSDGSTWTIKYHKSISRYVHIFPARSGARTFRVKANTLKSAVLYQIFSGKDYITGDDLNYARAFAGLPPVKDVIEVEAIAGLIEMLRDQ